MQDTNRPTGHKYPATCGELNGHDCKLPIAHSSGHRSDSDYRPNVQVKS